MTETFLSEPPPLRPAGAFGDIYGDLVADWRRDRRRWAVMTALIVIAGAVIGVIWGLWAPRDRLQTAEGGYLIVNGNSEGRVGGDVVLLMMLLAVAIVVFVVTWVHGPRRGLLALLVQVGDGVLLGLVAWGVGLLVTPTPSEHDLRTAGTSFDIDQRLHAVTVLLIPSLIVALAYLLLSMFSGSDTLTRRRGPA